MDEPLVCCICLTRDRPEYLKQAVECFERQTYQNKKLIIWNTSALCPSWPRADDHYEAWSEGQRSWRVGALRNAACAIARRKFQPEFIAYWDDDDWSSPGRLASQVELLTKNNVKVTGYHDMPFYDVANDQVLFYDSKMIGYAVGTSLMYRREVWERTPFPGVQCGEDAAWQHAVRRYQGIGVVSTSSLKHWDDWKPSKPDTVITPMMVARHHAGCVTEAQEQPRSMLLKQGDNYKPASPELDRAVRTCLFHLDVAQLIGGT